MSRIILKFYGEEETEEHTLVCFANKRDQIFIEIDNGYDTETESFEGNSSHILLDRETAIKLHKELKKQISFI